MDTDSQDFEVTNFWERLEKQPIVMLTDTFSGGLRSRPMAARIRATENAIWFLTDSGSAKVDEVAARPDVCVTIADTSANLYISVTGTCELVIDPNKISELWRVADKIFFDGPEDQRIILIRMDPSEGQTWSGPSGPVAAVKMVLSLITGTKLDLGEAHKVQLQG